MSKDKNKDQNKAVNGEVVESELPLFFLGEGKKDRSYTGSAYEKKLDKWKHHIESRHVDTPGWKK